jgi:alginate O-acetyltransferase complex protein AlgI
MVFSSPVFLFIFLPLILLGSVAIRSIAARNLLLLAGSLLFYTWGEGVYLWVLLCSIAGNTAFGIWIDSRSAGDRKLALTAGVAFNLVGLGTFKYAGFLAHNLNLMLSGLSLGSVPEPAIHLPLGISFFTFQALSYIIDVYRREAPVQKSVMGVALYLSLFPQLVAGPIVRYESIASQLSKRQVSVSGFADGIRQFCVGLAKKILIADILGAMVDEIFAMAPGTLSAPFAWLGLLCFTLQIYYDFSGYSDMALGTGRMLGFRFPENFRTPYASQSVREFWRRWHISLSSWFRDYVFIPLGGSRAGPLRVYANLLIVFTLCGLWHGASWTFLIWGFYHGFFLVVERMQFGVWLDRAPGLLRHGYLVLVVMLGWVFFRADDLTHALQFLSALFGGSEAVGLNSYLASHLTPRLLTALVAGILFSFPLPAWLARESREFSMARFATRDAAIVVLLLLSVIRVAAQAYSPFIYFRF